MTAAQLASALRLPKRTAGSPPWRRDLRRRLRLTGWFLALALVLVAAGIVIYDPPYKAGDALGYNLGLAGGVMMLTLLLYPLRKRIRILERTGGMRSWFAAHMVTGIVGPLLVVFHSAFRIGSINARVALYATLLVSASGVVGRFVYRHIHRGLYGRKLTLVEAEQELQNSTADLDSAIGQVPRIMEKLQEFHGYATSDIAETSARALRFVSLRRRGRAIALHAVRLADAALKQQASEGRWPEAELERQLQLARRLIARYVDATCAAAQFTVWEAMFSLWHVLHVPFVYLLVLCGIIHVVAVHMY